MGACFHAESLQLCPTLYDPMDCSPPGYSMHDNSADKNTGMGHHALLPNLGGYFCAIWGQGTSH